MAANLPHLEESTIERIDTQGRSKFRRMLRENKLSTLGLVLCAFFLVVAIVPDVVAPYEPLMLHPEARLSGPSTEYPLGTDQYGRDILSRIVYGTQISLAVAVFSMALALAVGMPFGLLAGYHGGWLDRILVIVMDVVFAFPVILLALAIMAVLGSNTTNVVIAIGIVNIPTFQRITRGSVLVAREMTYVEAARVCGASHSRIMWRHILPNVTGPLIVQTTVGLAYAIVVEAALSFLGFGTQPPAPSWGIMLSEGRKVLSLAPWMAIYPGLAISLAVLAFNLTGDMLRDWLDPAT